MKKPKITDYQNIIDYAIARRAWLAAEEEAKIAAEKKKKEQFVELTMEAFAKDFPLLTKMLRQHGRVQVRMIVKHAGIPNQKDAARILLKFDEHMSMGLPETIDTLELVYFPKSGMVKLQPYARELTSDEEIIEAIAESLHHRVLNMEADELCI